MFSFLSPWIFWLAATLGIPLLIHLLGRGVSRKKNFPSLLLIQEQLVRATQRQRVRNWLLLLVRTLFLALLLAALFRPVWHTRSPVFTREATSLFVAHNGAWGSIQVEGKTSLAKQLEYWRSLDSLGRVRLMYYLAPPDEGDTTILWRFGETAEMAARLELELSAGGGRESSYSHCFLPVFSWRDLAEGESGLLRLAEQFPETRFHLVDYSSWVPDLRFHEASFGRMENKAGIKASLKMDVPEWKEKHQLRFFLGSSFLRESALGGPEDAGRRTLNFSIPWKSQPRLTGHWSVEGPEAGSPYYRYHFMLAPPQKSQWLHLGSGRITLASLGENGPDATITHAPSADLSVMSGLADSLQQYSGILLSNPPLSTDEQASVLLTYLRQGGRLIITLGSQTDLSRLNRHLLAPAKLGHVASPVEVPSGSNKRLRALRPPVPPSNPSQRDGESANNNQRDLVEIKLAGTLEKYFPWQASAQVKARVVVDNEAGDHILLGTAAVGRGTLALWTTDLDDLAWSTLGASAMIPLWHQQLLKSPSQGWRNRTVITDTVWTLPWKEYGSSAPVLTTPSGAARSLESTTGIYQVGPFDETGPYRLGTPGDTLYFSANLRRPPRAEDNRPTPELKENFEIIEADALLANTRKSYVPLWKLFIFGALCMLVVEMALIRYVGALKKVGKE